MQLRYLNESMMTKKFKEQKGKPKGWRRQKVVVYWTAAMEGERAVDVRQ